MNHVDPNFFNVFLGADGVSNQIYGIVTLTLEFGKGAYRETLITEIPSPKPVDVIPPVVIPATYVTPTL